MFLTFAIAFLAIFAAFAMRIAIFNTMDDDREAREFLEDTFPTTNDLLFWHLWRVREKVAPQHRWKVETYFWLNILAALTILLAVGLYTFG